ncbi:MAG: hypothetical protein LQ352_004703 [Teloschistes flavicans]|nr:MAG: hypothetical protein LQ352_004703 [Teloschistes flavicans]
MPSFYLFGTSQSTSLTPPGFFETYPEEKNGDAYEPTYFVDQDLPASRYDSYGLEQYSLICDPGHAFAPLTQATSSEDNESRITQRASAFGGRTSGVHNPNAPALQAEHVHHQHSVKSRQLPSGANLPTPPEKEEIATGGVAAHLDYEMKQMTEFVVEMAQGMYDLYESRICLADIDIIRSVNPKASVAPAFRKYVLQILSSTRLPSSTILLGLHYLATRMSLLSAKGRYPTAGRQIYHMLTTALLLGSKFLDDNTFQNRSWSEVSNIPVKELNELELDWLVTINWNMHVDPEDPQGLTLWLSHWKRWQAERQGRNLKPSQLRSVDINVQRLPRASKSRWSPPYGYLQTRSDTSSSSVNSTGCDLSSWPARSYGQWPSAPTKIDTSPPSAPDSSPTTPEYYASTTGLGHTVLSQPASGRTFHLASQTHLTSLRQTHYQLSFPRSYVPPSWNGHFTNCNCTCCMPCSERYHITPGYGLQPVIG